MWGNALGDAAPGGHTAAHTNLHASGAHLESARGAFAVCPHRHSDENPQQHAVGHAGREIAVSGVMCTLNQGGRRRDVPWACGEG